MINLKRTPSQIEKHEVDYEENPYPWGTRIDIEDEHLEKVGVDLGVGDSVSITARAEVVSHSEHEGEGHQHKSMTFQFTDIDIVPASSDAIDTLYGEE